MFELRPAVAADQPFLEAMVLEAVNWTGEQRFTVEQLRAEPRLDHYAAGWPRSGDFGVIASDTEGRSIGAGWARFFPETDPGYGFVAADLPEITLAVLAGARGGGVGRALLAALLDAARERGLRRLSLSVEDGNRARSLYLSVGFAPVGRDGTSDTLVLSL